MLPGGEPREGRMLRRVVLCSVLVGSGVGCGSGSSGPRGERGPPGTQGSAGPLGPAGATGATGPEGPSGAQGVLGATGPQGATGPEGPTGPQGAPGGLPLVATDSGLVGDGSVAAPLAVDFDAVAMANHAHVWADLSGIPT